MLVPLVVAKDKDGEGGWEILSGHRRHACALAIGLDEVPCQVVRIASAEDRRRAVIDYNRQRRKTFRQTMREADALHDLAGRRRPPPPVGQPGAERRGRAVGIPTLGEGRTDSAVAGRSGWEARTSTARPARSGRRPRRATCGRRAAVEALDAGTKTIHAAYKDLRRRDRFTAGFRPTPYDVWNFRHDRAYGIPHPGSIPPGIVAHALHYFTPPGGLVVDPMAGGGTTIDVCEAMGRRCLAYDLHPVRPDITANDVNDGFPLETSGCDLVFADPPYHTMKAEPLSRKRDWRAAALRLGRLPGEARGFGLRGPRDPAGTSPCCSPTSPSATSRRESATSITSFLGYQALAAAGFAPERRVSCPMDGAYLPQHVRRARTEGRMLGQVRDLLVMRKPGRQEIGSPPASS